MKKMILFLMLALSSVACDQEGGGRIPIPPPDPTPKVEVADEFLPMILDNSYRGFIKQTVNLILDCLIID